MKPLSSTLKRVSVAAALLCAAQAAISAPLYDPALGSLPSAQGWSTTGVGPFTESVNAGHYQFGTLAANAIQAGSAHFNTASIDTVAGFTLDFNLRVVGEVHARDDRAGFSVIVTGQNPAMTQTDVVKPSDGIPRINIASPLQRRKAALHRRQPMCRQFLGRPTIRARHDADRPGLIVQIHLIPTNTEDLPGHTSRGIRPQERDQLCDVIRPCLRRTRLKLLLGLTRNRLDHPAERMRPDAVGPDIIPLHIHRDIPR